LTDHLKEFILIGMNKDYNITLGLTEQEIRCIKKGQPIKFVFPENETRPRISVSVEEMEDDLPLGDYMKLSIDKSLAIS
jgi:hypothetical protein